MNTHLSLSRRMIRIVVALLVLVGVIVAVTTLALQSAQAQTTNLALNKPTACSPNPQFPCAEAVDGNTGTRWGSAQGVDPQWIYVDLGATTTISRVVLIWEAAYASSYQIQVSADASTWTSIFSTTTGNGGTDDLTGLSGSGRYVRMYGTVRATGYGYSLWEFEVYGGGTPPPTTPPPTTPPPSGNTGWVSPSAQAAQSGGDGNGFQTSPTSAFADDSAYATDTDSGNGTSTSCTSTNKDRHAYYAYPISIPAGSTINGIEVRLDSRADSTSGTPRHCVELSWNNGTNWTAMKQTGTLTTSMASRTLGSASDNWGRSWTSGELTSATLRVRIVNVASSTSRDFFLDWVTVRVTYGGATPPPTTPPPTTPPPTTPPPTTPPPTTPPPTTPPPGCGTTNVALNKTATSSSNENSGTTPNLAVDGNTGTRWSSAYSDPQWIQIDLGASYNICRVVLRWETAYGRSYQIQVSASASGPWTNIYSTTTSDGGIDDLTGLSGSGRYVRMYGTVRATGWGYSLWEFEVYSSGGTPPPTTPPPTTPPPTTPPPTTPPGGWTTVWSDNFDGAANTSPSSANWILRTGTSYPGGPANWGTGEVETASASTANVYLDGGGHLVIRAIRDGAGNWTSGRIETQRTDFAANAGEMVRFSAILQQPNVASAAGYWPGFRATGAAYRGNFNNWPMIGEMDIMTNVNGRSQLSNTLHCGTAPGGVCNEYDGRTSGFATCAGCQTGFHEYSMIIDRTRTDEEIRFYLDGAQTWIVRESQVGVAAWNEAVHHGFFLTFVLSIGGSLPNALAGYTTPTSDTTSGGALIVDSISVARSTGSVPPAMTDPGIPAGPSVVRVTGSQGNWQLSVNGAPYMIKGLTYGPPQAAADGYMRDLQAMGVNTIRTWGVDDANTPTLLNTASRFGIKVIVGHWLNQGADYVNDAAYKNTVKTEIVNRVNALKGYQGVLMWDVGNEVILTMQDFGLAADVVEARRIAYAQFVNEVAVAIHAADPNHPVTSTDAWVGAWPYYRTYAPALDLLAVNSYGAIGGIKQAWIDGGYTKPYIITEAGPAGEWEVPNDVNGVPTEPTDLQKRDGYTFSWNTILSHPGVALGATEFHYGLENDFGGVWLNTFTGGWRRLGYNALKQAYSGSPLANTPPQITSMTVGSQTSVPAGGQFTVNATVNDPEGDPVRYNLMFSNKHITGGTGFRHVVFTQTGNGAFTVTAPQDMGVWKVYVYAYDGKGNVGIETKSFKVVPPTVPGTNIAIGRPTTASSAQVSPAMPASFATDGNFTTRWASDWSDPQWIQVDLGSSQTFNHIQLAWESAYGRAYQIQTSSDGVNWTTIYSTTTGDGGFDDINLNGSGRYVRLYCTTRATSWGYSLWEFGIYR